MREYSKKTESTSRTSDSNPRAFEQAPIDVILQRYNERNIQRYAPEEEEEPLQGKFDTAQREEIDKDELLQGKFDSVPASEQEVIQQEEKPNNTGLPDNLKSGIENLSGYSLDDVKVHYNSSKPTQLQALAYVQGTDIHVAPGQEKHLPHEAWHVVQQKQGRVQPTMQMKGVNVNDNEGLEREADVMGVQLKKPLGMFASIRNINKSSSKSIIQSKWITLYDMHLIWDKLIDGVRWYSNDGGKTIYYVIEDKMQVPEALLKSFKQEERKAKPYDEWESEVASEEDGKLPTEQINLTPGLGMEIELITKQPSIETIATPTEKIEEQSFKAIELYSIADQKVAVTYDSRTGYSESSASNLTIELVFHDSKVPLIGTDFEKLGNDIVEDVKVMTYSKLKESMISKLVKFPDHKESDKVFCFTEFEEKDRHTMLSTKKLTKPITVLPSIKERIKYLNSKTQSKKEDEPKELESKEQEELNTLDIEYKKHDTHVISSLNIHITMAMDLDSLGYLMKDSENSLSKKLGVNAYSLASNSDNSGVFIELFKKLLTAGEPIDAKHDPKQKMIIMNRTSFGKIFTLLNDNEKDKVIEWLEAKKGEKWKLTLSHQIGIEDLVLFFNQLKMKEVDSSLDPIYHANRDKDLEKIGVAHLGDKLEHDINGKASPIFEFRVGGSNLTLDDLPGYLKNLSEDIINFYKKPIIPK